MTIVACRNAVHSMRFRANSNSSDSWLHGSAGLLSSNWPRVALHPSFMPAACVHTPVQIGHDLHILDSGCSSYALASNSMLSRTSPPLHARPMYVSTSYLICLLIEDLDVGLGCSSRCMYRYVCTCKCPRSL